MININLVPWKREGCTMQQNTWPYQAFCYMIQHCNAYFKIVRLQKSKISIEKVHQYLLTP
jgi:hypothetical protein